ncbi:MAG: DUF5919 domain-containing protein [Acidimicrobiales bacterium]
MNTGDDDRQAEVVSIHSRGGYQPDMGAIARSHISSARQRLGMTPGEFAEVLSPMLGWEVTAGVVERWETTNAVPPGDALIAAGIVSRAAPVRADSTNSDDDLVHQMLGTRFADVEAVFVTRSEFITQVPLRDLFDGAKSIDAVGLSLNLICQQFPDDELRALIESGAKVRCAFLAPWQTAMQRREEEEGYNAGQLSTLTEMNLQILSQRVHQRLAPEHREQLEIRTYNNTIRFNIMVVDHTVAVVQPYMPTQRGIESPTLLVRSRKAGAGLFSIFERTFEWIWERSGVPG